MKTINVVDYSKEQTSPKVKASQIMRATRKKFTYGNEQEPQKPGQQVEVPQDQYVYTVVVTSNEPLTEKELGSLETSISKCSKKITSNNIVRQDFVPFVSDEMYVFLDGELGLKYLPKPKPDIELHPDHESYPKSV